MRMGCPCPISRALAIFLAFAVMSACTSAYRYSARSISALRIRKQGHMLTTQIQSSSGGSNDILQEISKQGTERERMKLFVFGLGYVGTKVAVDLRNRGWEVRGTCQDEERALSFEKKTGIAAYPFDIGQGKIVNRNALAYLNAASHVLVTIPPGYNGKDVVAFLHGQDMRYVVADALNDYMTDRESKSTNKETNEVEENSSPDGEKVDAAVPSKQWVGYLSSTGVYGDCKGSWVAESQPVKPISEKAKARVSAEGQWIYEYVRYGLPVHIFRLAGIYGPERSALDVLREANGDLSKCKPDDHSLVSRIHVDDIVQVLTSSMSRPTPGLIVNVADDRPATRYEVLSHCCKLLNYPLQAPAKLRGVGQQFIGLTRGGSKRVDNSLMSSLLQAQGKSLMYPDFDAGIRGILQEEEKKIGEQKRAKLASSIVVDASLGDSADKYDSESFDIATDNDDDDDDDDGYNLGDMNDNNFDVEALAKPTAARKVLSLEEVVDDLGRRLLKVEQALADLQ